MGTRDLAESLAGEINVGMRGSLNERDNLIRDYYYLVDITVGRMGLKYGKVFDEKRKGFEDIDYSDFVSDAMLGLVRAADSYEWDVPFKSHAIRNMRWAILGGIVERSPYSNDRHSMIRAFNKAEHSVMMMKNGEVARECMLEELSKDGYRISGDDEMTPFEKAEKIYDHVTNLGVFVGSLEEKKRDENGEFFSYLKTLRVKAPVPFSRFSFEGLLDGLDEREEMVMEGVFRDDVLQNDLMGVLGVGKSMVGKIKDRAVRKVAKKVEEFNRDFDEVEVVF